MDDSTKNSCEVLKEKCGPEITMTSMYDLLVGINKRLSTIESKITKIDAIDESIKSLSSSLGQLKLHVDLVDKSVGALKTRSNEHENNLLAVKNENSRIGRELKELKSNFNKRDQDIQGLSNIMDKYKENQEDKFIRDVKDLRTSISKVANDLNDESVELRQEIKHVISDLKEENEELRDQLLDQQCRSMKYNLIFTGIFEHDREDTINVVRSFIKQELEIRHRLEFANAHRFGAPAGRRGRGHHRPIVVRFLYQRDLEVVLSNAYRLKGTPFTIKRQFPEAIEQARRSLYPIMREKREQGHRVKLVRDVLYVDGHVYHDETESNIENDRVESPMMRDQITPENNHRNKRRRLQFTPRR